MLRVHASLPHQPPLPLQSWRVTQYPVHDVLLTHTVTQQSLISKYVKYDLRFVGIPKGERER